MKRKSFNLTIGLCVLLSLSISFAQKTKKTKVPEGMVLIPAGEFMMGSTEEEANDEWKLCKKYYAPCGWVPFKAEMPKHKVYLDAYKIDKYEVTNAQYKLCVVAGKCKKPDDMKWYDNKSYANHPVVNVDWERANTYCKWVGKRLPTEAEWEKASRGKNGNIFPWGNSWDENKCNNWNYKGSLTSQMAKMYQGRGTTPVGSFSKCVSPYGMVDIAGNVWEWVSDWYDKDYYEHAPNKNPKGPNKGMYKVLRGGSWGGIFFPSYFRGAYRFVDGPTAKSDIMGFRCAKSSD